MRAITLIPGKPGSARLDDVPEPSEEQGDVLVDGLALGICGTDAEIVRGEYGFNLPNGEERMILGHESLGRVRECPDGSGLSPGDLVVGIVRRPDPVPCSCCARGEFDFCRNGRYTERGIKERHGYGSERWRVETEYAVRLDPSMEAVGVLVEPTSVVAKAWEQIERISERACHDLRSVLVTGAGPIGMLAAMLGVQRGLEVHVLDTVKDGIKPELVKALGATYHSDGVKAAGVVDVVIEATGVGQLIIDALGNTTTGGIVCLTGVSPSGRTLEVDIGTVNRTMVLQNEVMFGSVNANHRHYDAAAEALGRADQEWLGRLITRRVPLARWAEALDRKGHEDVKVVVALDA
jgi:threonine dehydrogenase-like Zn-dependent dehydrogenase